MASISGMALASPASKAQASHLEQQQALRPLKAGRSPALMAPIAMSNHANHALGQPKAARSSISMAHHAPGLKQSSNVRINPRQLIRCEAKHAAAIGAASFEDASFESRPSTNQRIFGSLFHHHNANPPQPPTPSSNHSLTPATSFPVPSTPTLTHSTLTPTESPPTPPFPLLDTLTQAWKPALVSLLLAATLWYTPGDALAASSGGRAGGNSFSASRARSYSAPSQSYSAPSPGYSSPSYVAPSYSVPFFAPSPFFGGWGWSPFAPTVVIAGGGGGGGGIFGLLFFGVVAYFLVSSILSFMGQSDEEEIWEETQRSSVARLQVGLMGSARQLQKDLERMATRADTNTPEGLHYVLQESVLSLLRNPDYCIYGYSTSEITRDSYEGEQAFNRLSMEERSKFREETLVNVGSVQKRAQRSMDSVPGGSEYIVVTIIAATEGEMSLPEIRSAADLRSALTILGSITADDLQAVEILWTPENENDTLTTKDMLQDYPLLRPL